ncbi:MAG: MATE family efflux transporter [Candidatus Hydrogenedentota bacterium]
MPSATHIAEPRWTGAREVMQLSWPIILGTFSYSVMDFADKLMVAQLGPIPLAAIGSAAVWSWTLGTIVFGIVTSAATFVAQSLGRGRPEVCACYAWQAIYVALLAFVVAAVLYPLAGYGFRLMNHEPAVTHLEVTYFRIRLLGYPGMAWVMGLGAFFQAVNHSRVPMYTAFFANACNIGLNYLLIFGKLGFPELGVAGAATATVFAQWLQAVLLTGIFLNAYYHREFGTRTAWRFDKGRTGELLRIGVPAGMSMFIDVANWGVFISFVVGHFGAVALASNNVAVTFMHLSFMPAVGVSQGVAALVGQYIGAGDIPRAKARTYTALRIACMYMAGMGLIFILFGRPLTAALFSDDPAVIDLARWLLVLAGIFQVFDAVAIISMGALRGAGDTRWMMWATFFLAYLGFLPAAFVLAYVFEGGAFGAWVGATVYVVALSSLLFVRFRSERWRHINIFTAAMAQTSGNSTPPAGRSVV